MNGVMVDNWLLEELIDQSNNNSVPESLCLLLSAIVLWDSVEFPLNSNNYWRKVDVSANKWSREIESLRNTLGALDDVGEAYDYEKRVFFKENRHLFDEDVSEVVGIGALRYLKLSNSCGLDYLPCSKRREFICKYPNICKQSISRINSLEPLDREIKEFLDDLSRAFGGNYFSIEHPVLVDYILRNTPEDMSYVDYALHLKCEGPVIQYRRYLEELEKAINNQNIMELIKLRNYSKEVVQDIVNTNSSTIISADLNLFPIPSIAISKSIDAAKKMHITFLENLTRFSFSERRII